MKLKPEISRHNVEPRDIALISGLALGVALAFGRIFWPIAILLTALISADYVTEERRRRLHA